MKSDINSQSSERTKKKKNGRITDEFNFYAFLLFHIFVGTFPVFFYCKFFLSRIKKEDEVD